VTVLSSDDPVRVVQRFATLDAASNGRAEVILGRGSFTESFPLFGYELSQYEELFEEKLDLFAALIRQESVTWHGKTRPALVNQRVFPPIERGSLKTWIGVGGSPESVVRAARYDMPLMLAIIGGDPRRFRPYVDLYHRAFEELGKPVQPIGVHSPGYLADTDEQAREELWPDYKRMRDRIGAERGWPPMGRAEFDREADHGSLYVGAPETVARKIAAKSKHVVKIGKEAFYRQLEMGLADAYMYASEVMVDNMMARDAEEGIGAFIEKREPKWQDK